MAESSSIEQQKILRVLKLINLLQGKVGKSVHRLAEMLGTDERTVYRYFKLLEALGFEILKEQTKYKIEEKSDKNSSMSFGTFSKEEFEYLDQLIKSQANENLLRDSLLQKISVRSESYSMLNEGSQHLFKANLSRLVEVIGKGIRSQKMIWLKEYYSLSSDTTSDRLVEPIAFTSNYESIYCFEVESKSMKIFKIERIGEVVLSQNPWKFKSKHTLPAQQIFGFAGKNKFKIKLKLSKRAFQLMLEEHPAARPYMFVKNRKQYFFEGEVPHLPGLGRFILGLPGEIKIEKGEELKEYLIEQVSKIIL
jgi:predicted DNA-binding transcriptional regulator YafY